MGGVLKSPTPGRTGSSPESDGWGAKTMLRQMVRNGARAGRKRVDSGKLIVDPSTGSGQAARGGIHTAIGIA